LLRDGDVLASAEIVSGALPATFCLAGRNQIDGALVANRALIVHTAGARTAVDAAFLDADMVVLATVRLPPWRLARRRRGTRTVVHAPAGSFERWGLVPGDKLELRETR
jgi:uncharacterized protein